MFGIARLLSPEQIKVDLKAKTSEEAIEELLDLLPAKRIDKRKVKKLFLERERQASTALSCEVAIPHIRTDLTDGAFYLLIGRSQQGIDFHEAQGVLSKIIFLIIGPKNATEMYLKLLAQISTLMKDVSVREKIMQAKSNFGILEVFVLEEEKLKPQAVKISDADKDLLIIVMYQEEYVEDVLAILLSFNVTKATILDGVGIGKAMAFGIPLFNSFRDIMQEDQPTNQTILAVVSREVVGMITQKIETLCGDLDLRERGMLLTVPIRTICGLGKSSEEV